MRDWMLGLIQGIFASLLAELLLALGVAALIAYLRAKRERWAGPALYGLAAFAMVFVIGFTITGRAPLSKPQPETTSENVESNIRAWSDDLGLGVTKQQPGSDADFLYMITLHSGRPVFVGRVKKREGYLQFTGTVTVSKLHQDLIAKLSPSQQNRFTEELLVELARSRIGYSISPPVVTLVKSSPITAGFSEASFAGYLDELDSTLALCQEAIPLAIDHASTSQH